MHDKELQELVKQIKEYAPNANVELVEKAYYFGKKAHEGQLEDARPRSFAL